MLAKGNTTELFQREHPRVILCHVLCSDRATGQTLFISATTHATVAVWQGEQGGLQELGPPVPKPIVILIS